ncbi:MAG: DNA polymerase III subunit gamma/tau [Bacilli bacterium]|nr:DNA polymerase III subunit gamma/tau [Bacilli bacterium]
MVYQALYRKYRPSTFDEVCGQSIVVNTLKNAINNNKLSHAYLFIGPRGTGKTSIAKIFAKTINCESQKNGCSCEKCDICKMCNNNENVDIIEMDAASNNGVDEIREIKNHVSLMPTFSKYKIYIIDEVHMLSAGAFNALLKTLEEPPKHVIFILATTEIQKVPLTIISRCQNFEFKSIPKNLMTEKIKYICTKENIKISDDAIEQICIDSSGGLRDAIGLLDQLNSYTNGDINLDDVLLLNGRISVDNIKKLFNFIIDNDINSLFDLSNQFENDGKDYIFICEDIIKYLKNNLIDFQKNNINELVSSIGKENIINIIFDFNDYLSKMRNSKNKKIFFDLLLIKILEYKRTNVRAIDKKIIDNKESDFDEKNNSEINVEENKEEIIDNDQKSDFKDEKNNEKYKFYEELMNIRLNNILAEADKESLNNYLTFKNDLENNLDNLDERKIFNLLLDCTIKAGSKDGIILTTSNNNILYELYDDLFSIESLFINKLNKELNICIYDNSNWEIKRKIYVEKIKNKEKIELLDEKEVLDKIKESKSEKKSEFDDLLEIGE